MNFIAKHLIGGVAFVVGIILLIIGLFGSTSGFVWTGSLLAIGGVAFTAYNMYKVFTSGGMLDATSQLAFGSKESQKRRSARRLGVADDLDLGDD